MNSELVNLLRHACSQTDPDQVKAASARLSEFEKNPIFVTGLAQVYAQLDQIEREVRLAAVLQLKHALDKYWKPRDFSLDQENRTLIKSIFVNTLPNETFTQIAIQVAIITAKIIRKDGNGSWPELFKVIHENIQGENELTKAGFSCSDVGDRILVSTFFVANIEFETLESIIVR